MGNECILVVDDEREVLKLVRANLKASGYKVLTAVDGPGALALLDTEPVNLVILDIVMPSMSGFEVLKRLRSDWEVPVIMLSARRDESDKVDALTTGADDYLTKPFGPQELLARITAVLRRTKGQSVIAHSEVYRYDDLEFDLAARKVRKGGQVLHLSLTESNLLFALVSNCGKVLTHRTLLRQVWGPEYADEHTYLWAFIRRLRVKLEKDPNNPQLILTEPGIGYSFRSSDRVLLNRTPRCR